MGAAFVFATGIYGTAAGAAYAILRHRGFSELGIADFVLPSRWENITVAKGNRHIATASALSRSGRLREALIVARHGVARAPRHREGRLLLADLLAKARRLEAAEQTLVAGLSFHHDDPRYVQRLFEFLLKTQADARVVQLAREHLARGSLSPHIARLSALAGATASHLRDNYDDAEDLLRTVPDLLVSREGRLLAAQINWSRGLRELALIQLRSLGATFPADAEIHRELISRLRQEDRLDEARRACLTFQLAHPELAGPRIELARAYRELGDTQGFEREIATLLRDFRSDGPALLAAADLAAEKGDVALAQRLLQHARVQGLPEMPHLLLVTEAMLAARDYAGALNVLDSLPPTTVGAENPHQAIQTGLRAVATFGAGDVEAGQLLLSSFLHMPGLSAEHLLALANRFVAANADEEAWRILTHATALEPLHRAALSRLVELDLTLNRIDDLPARLTRLLALRQPSPEILRVARHKLGSDLFLFSADREPVLDAIQLALQREPVASAHRS